MKTVIAVSALAVILAAIFGKVPAWWALIAIALTLIYIAGRVFRWAFLPDERLPKYRVKNMQIRAKLHVHPVRGLATWWDMHTAWGRKASWKAAAAVRPGLDPKVLRGAPDLHSALLGWGHLRYPLLLPMELHIVIFSPPRQGKTVMLGSIILHYPGPVVVTSTKRDVYRSTSVVRAKIGPIWMFDPQGTSTFGWQLIRGCADPDVAQRRVDGFMNGVSCEGMENGSFWIGKSTAYLHSLFIAADIVGGDMRIVTRWALGDTLMAENILRSNGHHLAADELKELRDLDSKAAGTCRMYLSQALGFMKNPRLAAAVLPTGNEPFDFEKLIRENGTLYMVASSKSDKSPLASLFSCMASEAHFIASQIADDSKHGRLDPPMLMALDEAARICPVPVPAWVQDSGGRGIQIITVAHGTAQLAERWGSYGQETILDTAGAIVFLPGITNKETLEMASFLTGKHGFFEHGDDKYTRHEAMSTDMVQQMPDGYALIIRGNKCPILARTPRVYKDKLLITTRESAGHEWVPLTQAASRSVNAPLHIQPAIPPPPKPPVIGEVLPVDDKPRPWRARDAQALRDQRDGKTPVTADEDVIDASWTEEKDTTP